jgi:hypothetical protein
MMNPPPVWVNIEDAESSVENDRIIDKDMPVVDGVSHSEDGRSEPADPKGEVAELDKELRSLEALSKKNEEAVLKGANVRAEPKTAKEKVVEKGDDDKAKAEHAKAVKDVVEKDVKDAVDEVKEKQWTPPFNKRLAK